MAHNREPGAGRDGSWDRDQGGERFSCRIPSQSCPKPCGAPIPVKRSVEGLGDGGLVVLAIAVLCELGHNVEHFAGALTSQDGVNSLLDGIRLVFGRKLE